LALAVSILFIKEDKEPVANEKPVTPKSIIMIQKIFSVGVQGVISP